MRVQGKSSPGTPEIMEKNIEIWGVPEQSSIENPEFDRSSKKISKHPPKRELSGQNFPGTPNFTMFFPRKTGVRQRFSCENSDLSIKNKKSRTKFYWHPRFGGV